jgi:hypothetical protein
MNEVLKEIVIKAGAPKEVVDELWFNIFCQKFADELMTVLEQEVEEQV